MQHGIPTCDEQDFILSVWRFNITESEKDKDKYNDKYNDKDKYNGKAKDKYNDRNTGYNTQARFNSHWAEIS